MLGSGSDGAPFDLQYDALTQRLYVGGWLHEAGNKLSWNMAAWSEAPATLGFPYCFGAACPCGDPAGPAEGCANSTGHGAALEATGSASIGADVLLFRANGIAPNQPLLHFHGVSRLNGGNGSIFGDGLRCFGDGLRCFGGGLKRLGVEVADSLGHASWGPSRAARGAWSAGDVRFLQSWYRDSAVVGTCGAGFNFTHGLELQLAP